MACLVENPDWAYLPNNILDLIMDKLVAPHADYIQFSIVCKPWRAAVIGNHKLRRKQPPLLVVPANDNSEGKRSLYDIIQRKIISFQIPVPYKRRCCGSSHGWLAISDKNLTVTLINPFTGSVIHLPSVTSEIIMDENEDDENYICKVILSEDPSLSPDNYVVVGLFGPFRSIAIIRPGDETWTYTTSNLESIVIHDVIFHKGKIYAVNWRNGIISVDVTTPLQPQEEMVVPPKMSNYYKKSYIVESSEGDLLVVHKTYKKQPPCKTRKFKVFKVQQHPSEPPKLVKVKNLGGDALFLGDNNSMSVAASNFPGCQPNCIYYTGYNLDFGNLYARFWPRDTCFFNLEDKSFGLHYPPNPADKNMPPPIWISPSLRGEWV